ncbi:hypothetical protein ZWY2020_015301 [Hordeum vulgare]|nr:hypothetical protein ZWY2020_015301 [Hordeum vulgare]
MSRNKSFVVLSRLLLHCRSCRHPPSPAVYWCYHQHCATSLHHLTEKVRGRFLPRHIKPSRNASTASAAAVAVARVPSPWYHNPMKVAGAITLFIGSATIAVNLRYRETVPFTGRTRLVIFSPNEAREIDEARFEEFKNKNASHILEPDHPDTIRVRRIAHAVITAAHVAFALKQQQAMSRTSMHHGGLNWMDGLNWEVTVIKDLPATAKSFPGAGKIIVSTYTLEYCKTDAEIAVSIAHEVGHVIQRATSSIIYSNWWLKIIKQMPCLSMIMLPTLRRHETEADHIGMLLLAAAGYDPRTALLDCYMSAKMEGDLTTKWKNLESYLCIHPSDRKRLELLLQPEVIEEALDLYKQVAGIGQG